MADEPAKTPIQSKYAQQYADDLAANRKEQGDVTAQITGLQERLAQLKSEEEWLAQALGSLPEAPAPSTPEAPAPSTPEAPPSDAAEQAEAPVPAETVADAPQSVPQQRQDRSVTEEQPRKPAKKTAPAKTAPAKKTTRKKAAKTTTAKTTAKKTTARTTAKKAAAKKTAAEEAPAQPAGAAEAPADTAAAKEKSGPPLWQHGEAGQAPEAAAGKVPAEV